MFCFLFCLFAWHCHTFFECNYPMNTIYGILKKCHTHTHTLQHKNLGCDDIWLCWDWLKLWWVTLWWWADTGGENIRAIMQQSRAHVEISHGQHPPGHKIFLISGDPDQIDYARSLIDEKVNGVSLAQGGIREGNKGKKRTGFEMQWALESLQTF